MTGVCRVLEIGRPAISAADARREYYVLKPLYQEGLIYTPVDQTRTPIRPVMTREEADALIDAIPGMEVRPPAGSSGPDLLRAYSQKLQSRDQRELLELTMTIYAKNREAREKKRRLGAVEEKIWRQAEQLLHGELATALDIPLEELEGYIAARTGQ